jgi:galactokinase
VTARSPDLGDNLMAMGTKMSPSWREEFGGEPDGVWAAPGRVNLIGEHTDYNDGFCLPFALPHRVTVAARRGPAGHWRIRSLSMPGVVEFGLPELDTAARVTGWAAYPAGVVWALREAGHDVPGADLLIDSDVPAGAGLSSSAALECAVLRALHDLGGLDIPLAEQARLAQRAENDYAGMPCGIMDQSASVLCQDGHALFLDTRTGVAEQVPFDVAVAGLAVLVIDTQAPHELVDGEYAARRASCEQAAALLGVRALRDVSLADLDRIADPVIARRARHVVTENARVLDVVALLRAGDLRGIGPLLTASHASLRDDFEVTVPQLDTAVDAALAAGALGARMTGGGFGGCVIALVDSSAADEVAGAVTKAFDRAGFDPPAAFTATPSPGARRTA